MPYLHSKSYDYLLPEAGNPIFLNMNVMDPKDGMLEPAYIFTATHASFTVTMGDIVTDSDQMMALVDNSYYLAIKSISGAQGSLTSVHTHTGEGVLLMLFEYVPNGTTAQTEVKLDGVSIYDSGYVTASGNNVRRALGNYRSNGVIAPDIYLTAIRYRGKLDVLRRASGSTSRTHLMYMDLSKPN